MKKIEFDDYAENYNAILEKQLEFFEADNSYFSEYKILKVKQLLAVTPKTILDFGCGVGRGTHFFQHHFPEAQIYGCDISEKSLMEAKKNNPNVCFLATDNISSMTFDLVFLAGVMHHIDPLQRQLIFDKIVAVSKPGTSLMVFEHNPFNPMTRYLVKTCPFDRDAVLLKAKELKLLFANAGFKHIRCDYTLFFPDKLKWFRRFENYLRGIPLGGQYVVSGLL